MNNNRHRKALSSFESDDQFEGVETKLLEFKSKQRKQAKTSAKKFQWIEEERRLKLAEASARKQLSNSLCKLISSSEKNKDSRVFDEAVALNKQISALDDDTSTIPLQLAIDVKNTIQSLSKQDEHAGVCAQLILDLKAKLFTMEAELEEQHATLATKAKECRSKAMQLVREHSTNFSSQTLLSSRLATAIADARATQHKLSQISDENEHEFCVDILEHEVTQQLAAFKCKNPTKSASQEDAKMLKTIENNAIKALTELRNEMERRYTSNSEKKQNKFRSNSLRLQIQTQQIEKENSIKVKQMRQMEERGKLIDFKNKQELQLLEKSMASKQALWERQTTNATETTGIKADFESEVARLSKHRENKERTKKREIQRQNKITSQQHANMASSKAEELRLERLSALAASVPYYRDIINAESDIHKTTEARKNDVYMCRDASLADFQCGLQQLRCFTNDKVFSDSKFRLANALHEAGVAQSVHARNVVRQAIPRSEERTTGIRPY